MKLNLDCVRDILLTVEAAPGARPFVEYPKPYPLLDRYTKDEVAYHIKQCELSGLLAEVKQYYRGGFLLKDLSPDGHAFLANIRQDAIWAKVKASAKKAGAITLSSVVQIAAKVAAGVIFDRL